MVDPITADTPVDLLVSTYPHAVGLLIAHGLPCVVCGEPYWGSLSELAQNKGWKSGQIEQLISQLRVELNIRD